jgi:glycosyltransferase involved in cell wall biosynthesis
MKILYVAGMGIPLKDILSGKKENEVTHSPGFFQPWYRLSLRGHQVDFVVTSNFDDYREIEVDWFSKDNLRANIFDPALEGPVWRRIPRRINRLFRLAYQVNKALREEDYDFVICWAFFEGFVGNILANWHGVPCGMRSMGTALFPELEKYGRMGAALRNPVEFFSFKLPKSYFLMTDDGSRGDKVFEAWRPSRGKYDYLFWRTGVQFKTLDEISVKINAPEEPYIFFAARFELSKRHHLIVETLIDLHARGQKVQLYFAGAIQSQAYYERVMTQVKDAGLLGYVKYLGSIPGDELRFYAHHAAANPFMYDGSNLGNVFFETYTTGGIIVGLNDGRLNDYVHHGRNGFLIQNTQEAADIIEDLILGNHDLKAIRQAAIEDSRQRCFTMDQRFDAEVTVIENVVMNGRTGCTPGVDGICRLNKST